LFGFDACIVLLCVINFGWVVVIVDVAEIGLMLILSLDVFEDWVRDFEMVIDLRPICVWFGYVGLWVVCGYV
jgi:hypothetical protein